MRRSLAPTLFARTLLALTLIVVGTLGVAACSSSGGDADADVSQVGCTKNVDCAGVQVSGPCALAVCNVASGKCVEASKQDGAGCDSGDSCVVAGSASCQAGACVGAPVPDQCGARECGQDNCGNACGNGCPAGELCGADGMCGGGSEGCGSLTFDGCCSASGDAVSWCDEAMTPQTIACASEGRVCAWSNDDGFFQCVDPGSEGVNPDGAPYTCEGEPPCNACAQVECGWDCGVDCGACGAGELCDGQGQCVANACGGPCAAGFVCDTESASCVADPCTFTGLEGCCDDQTNWFCQDGEPGKEDCAGACGWNAEEGWYDCTGTGEDPSGDNPLACGQPPMPDAGPEPEAEPEPEAVEPHDTDTSDTSDATDAAEVIDSDDTAQDTPETAEDVAPVDGAPEDVAAVDGAAGDDGPQPDDGSEPDLGSADATD